VKYLTFVLVAAALGLATASWFRAKEIDAERAQANRELTLRHDVEKRIGELEHRRPTSAAPSASPGATTTAAVEVQHVETAPSQPPSYWQAQRIWQENEDEERRRRLADPATRELMRAEIKAELRAEHLGLERAVGLSADEYDRLLDLLVSQRLENMEQLSDSYAWATTFAEQQSRNKQQVAELLGAENAQGYETFLESIPARREVQRFRAHLSDGERLSDAQVERMIEAVQAAAKRLADEPPPPVGNSSGVLIAGAAALRFGPSEPGTSIEDHVLAQLDRYEQYAGERVASILTVQQRREYERFRNNERARTRLNLREMLAMRAAN
jgi:hypothetical protein